MIKLEDAIKERILILDGAMGTMIQTYALTEQDYRGARFKDLPGQQKGNNDLLTLTRPDIIAEIHRKYLDAGADIIETNTFSAQRVSMADYHLEAYCGEMNRMAVRLARSLADKYTANNPEKPRFVAGSVGPTGKSCSMSPDVDNPALRNLTFDELAEAYKGQMEILIEEGVDALLIETVFDTLNAKAALYAAEQAMQKTHRVPLMLSITIADKAGRTLSGQTIGAFLASVAHADLFSVGLNCSFGAADMKPFLRELAKTAPYYISVYPNAGLPNSLGGYDQTPQEMAKEVAKFLEEGWVNIIGGCCGTTDAFIAEYPRLVRREDGTFFSPHKPCEPKPLLHLSGLNLLKVSNVTIFLNIGERCNVAGSRKFLRLIKEKKYDEAVNIARQQVESGAQVLDINMDDGLLETADEMVNFLNLLVSEPEIAKVPFMIDSSQWEVIEAALKCVQGKCIVNSISLKEGEETFLKHARSIRRFGASVVVMAFDEEGQAETYERKISICERAYRLLVNEAKFRPCDIIFDPNILAICTGMAEHNAYAADFIRATEWIRENLPDAHVSGGVSNLSFSFRGNPYIREAMHAVFLYHAIRAGMDMGIVNPATSVLYTDIPQPLLDLLEDVVLNRRDAADELIAMAASCQGEERSAGEAQAQEAAERCAVGERLAYALLKGVDENLEKDLAEALETYPQAVDIIEGPLMDAMNTVGERFGKGQMFLPQVVKTARTMKKAVTFLLPHMEQTKETGSGRGKILLATVKGDVHDIGKNIVSVVLACNNYEICDLGVMCPPEQIVDAALRENADMVGLCGLITPSLDEMVNTARAMQAAGLNVPLLIVGATTSKLHTALKIVPVYDGPVVWVKDASQMVPVAAALSNAETRATYVADLYAEYDRLCKEHQATQNKIFSLEEARKNKLNLFD